MPSRSGRESIINILLILAVAALAAESIALSRQNRRLKSPSADTEFGGAVPEGSILRNISGVDLAGQLRAVPMPVDGAHQLLIITFASGCPACSANQAETSAVAGVAQRAGWRVLWVGRDPIGAASIWSRAAAVPPNEVLASVPAPTYAQLGMRSVPRIIAVGAFGHVERVWTGRLASKDFAVVSAFVAGQRHAITVLATPDGG